MNSPQHQYAEQKRRTTGLLAAIVFIAILIVGYYSTPTKRPSQDDAKDTRQQLERETVASQTSHGSIEDLNPLAMQSFPNNIALQIAISQFADKNENALSQSKNATTELKNVIQNVSHLQSSLLKIASQVSEQTIATQLPSGERSRNADLLIADATRSLVVQHDREIDQLRTERTELELEKNNLYLEIARLADKTQSEVDMNNRRAAFLDDYDEIKFLLKPFISKGYRQPNGREGFAETVDKGPVSFDLLKNQGYLERTREGLISLYKFGGSFNRVGTTNKNDRQLGTFPIYQGNYRLGEESIVEPVKRAQELLKKHGQAMIEAEMLAK